MTLHPCPRCGRRAMPCPRDRFCLHCERSLWGRHEDYDGREDELGPELACGDCGVACDPWMATCFDCGGPVLTAEERAERDAEAEEEEMRRGQA